MSITISDLPEYGQAAAAYNAAKAEAEEHGDQLKLAHAEAAWATAKANMTVRKAELEQSEGARKTAIAQAKLEFPHAPEELYSTLTDPAQIAMTAKAVHERIAAAMPPPPPVIPGNAQPTGQSWGSPPTGGQAPQPDLSPEEQERHRQSRSVDLRQKFMSKEPMSTAELNEMERLALAPLTGKFDASLPRSGA